MGAAQKNGAHEAALAGAILGRLFPPLDLAAEDLYVSVSAGERLDSTHVPSTLGFETGVVDHVLLEAFKACVPTVQALLAGGGMTLIAEWIRHRSTTKQQQQAAAELQRRLQELELMRSQLQAFRQSMERMVELLLRYNATGDRHLTEAKLLQIIAEVPERIAATKDCDLGD
ncbi:MAG TPA: hypothetical protein VF618_12365 [Thermoanaerobaculia bacterium]